MKSVACVCIVIRLDGTTQQGNQLLDLQEDSWLED